MRASPGRLMALLVLLPLLGGCVEDPPSPPTAPTDIVAPPPEDFPETVEFVEPPDEDNPYNLRGRVFNETGAPMRNATVFVESVNLRDPRNNIAAYVATRNATKLRTDAEGRFGFVLEGGYYYVLAIQTGYLPVRASKDLNPEGPTRVEIHMVPLGKTQAIAHRGASYYAPENTLSSMHKAFLVGAQYAEVDVVLTADLEPILVHDQTLDRTTNGTGLVNEKTLAEVRALDAGAWFHQSFRGESVPTLKEALEFARSLNRQVFVDVKARADWRNETDRRVIEVIRETGMEQRAVFASFNASSVAYCGAQGGLRCALVTGRLVPPRELVDEAANLSATSLLIDQRLVEPGLMDYAASRGLRVYAWTSNWDFEWQVLADRGVDGILTDRPGFLTDFLVGYYGGGAS